MTIDKKIAIVLGGTVPHVELVKQLKDRGYYTILIDYYDNPPAKIVADEHIKESTLDCDIVLRIAQERRADLVISTCIDQANLTACYVGEKLGLPIPYSYQTALNVTDKNKMKKIMLENDIPTSKYVTIKKIQDVENVDLQYPVMVKPADSNSSSGVKKATNQQELYDYTRNAISLSRTNTAIVEEFKAGKEVSVYSFIEKGKAKILMTLEKHNATEGEDKVWKCYASTSPANLSSQMLHKIEKISTHIAKSFELDNTPLFFQSIIQDDGINIIEFAPRIGGGLSYWQIMLHTHGLNLIGLAIDSFLNIDVHLSNSCDYKVRTCVQQLLGLPCVFEGFSDYQHLKDDGTIYDLYQNKGKGVTINNTKANEERLGSILVVGTSREEILEKVKKAIFAIDAYDISGQSILRRDLYLQ